jgi:RND family efflux transporter MFP subunit
MHNGNESHGHATSVMEVQPAASTAPHHDDVTGAAAPRTPEQRRRAGRRAGLLLAVVAVAAAGAGAASTWPRLATADRLAETTHRLDQARRSVTIVAPTASAARAEVRLPGSTSPLQETVLYARTSGYITALHADIGDRVKAGQLLATIASPEVDQQLSEARARLQEGKANLVLAESRLNRIRAVAGKGAASVQELDDAQAVYNSQLATQRVSETVVSRLETDQAYQKVVAPFDGVVTRRTVDVGSLITAGSGTNVSSLFELQQQATIRVFVDVPQAWAPSVKPGAAAGVEFREFPGERFAAEVVRTGGALDPRTRTMRAELHLPNPDGRLMAGMYGQVTLSVAGTAGSLVVPANTLVIDAAGVHVVVADAGDRLARRPVRLGRDFGKEVEVVSGLAPDARLVVSPRDDLADGEHVTVVTSAKTAVAAR